jgi:hypothetical protein
MVGYMIYRTQTAEDVSTRVAGSLRRIGLGFSFHVLYPDSILFTQPLYYFCHPLADGTMGIFIV